MTHLKISVIILWWFSAPIIVEGNCRGFLYWLISGTYILSLAILSLRDRGWSQIKIYEVSELLGRPVSSARTTNYILEARKAPFYSRYIMNITKIIRRNISKMISKSPPECSTKCLVSPLPEVLFRRIILLNNLCAGEQPPQPRVVRLLIILRE